PAGFHNLESFHLEGTTPVWRYALADQWVEKRIWMEPGADRTYVQYQLAGERPLQFDGKVLLNVRNHHGESFAGDFHLQFGTIAGGVSAPWEGIELSLQSDRASFSLVPEWYEAYHLAIEAYRGQPSEDAHLCAGHFRATLTEAEPLTLVFGTAPTDALDGATALVRRQVYETGRVTTAVAANPTLNNNELTADLQQLVLAADQFIVDRPSPEQPDGKSVIAGYHWFTDWGRDTMIALPGLCLATGRYQDAAIILRTFARHVDQGMIPNRFPDETETPEYNTVDATLWYVEAIRAYVAATDDLALLRDLYPTLTDIISWHLKGTRYGIGMDPADSLLRAGAPGVQLTWMDAKVDDWVVTPRSGKAVEINALWYNALCAMKDFARQLGHEPERYRQLSEQVRHSFERFWYVEGGYCYDLLERPEKGADPALRPNQLFAVSLHHSPLNEERAGQVVAVCQQKLWTSHGLRSLAAADPAYIGHYGGDRYERDGAYHQGTVWGWLIGPMVAAHWRVFGDRQTAINLLRPLFDHLADHGIGSLSEIFDGDAPFTPRGCIAQAWSVAEVLRVWRLIHDEEKHE
ncbi:MAG: glycogen debranching enzyme family protein, partial [Anaerolineales bacterium]|nr:glycogen debranching enzyme family protein [Anaerolineales bacterium]